MNIKNLLAVMETAALRAGSIVEKLQPKSRRLSSRKDFLSDADLQSESIILEHLTNEYPDIPALSEEKGGERTTKGRLWIIDPIDGTINFFLQDDHWAISIALVEDGLTLAGLIYAPARKQIFSASSSTASKLQFVGGSDSMNLNVNKEKTLSNSQFWLGWGKEENHGNDHDKVYSLITKLDRCSLYPQIRNSATMDLMSVAQGRIGGYVFLKPEPFDIAAACLIVERAGGKVTDLDGHPWTPFSSSIVASNGVIHDGLLEVIK
ncbi:MAG: inositol monophosphatase [Candidatus Taylorbacteria bacterium]|nr:inositol monophosphatase [Candidatus Taylorbacteria bacterium]